MWLCMGLLFVFVIVYPQMLVDEANEGVPNGIQKLLQIDTASALKRNQARHDNEEVYTYILFMYSIPLSV